MPKQIVIPPAHAEVFKAAALADVEYSASSLEDFVSCMRKGSEAANRAGLDHCRGRLQAAQAVYDQVVDQEGSLVVDVNDAVAAVLSCIVDDEADHLRGVVQGLATPEMFPAMRERLDAITVWVELIESLADEMFAYTKATDAYYETLTAHKAQRAA